MHQHKFLQKIQTPPEAPPSKPTPTRTSSLSGSSLFGIFYNFSLPPGFSGELRICKTAEKPPQQRNSDRSACFAGRTFAAPPRKRLPPPSSHHPARCPSSARPLIATATATATATAAKGSRLRRLRGLLWRRAAGLQQLFGRLTPASAPLQRSAAPSYKL